MKKRKERGVGPVVGVQKRPAAEDLMALSVRSLVGSLAGYRCPALRWLHT